MTSVQAPEVWELSSRSAPGVVAYVARPDDIELRQYRVGYARQNARLALEYVRFWRDMGLDWIEPVAVAGLRAMLQEYRDAQEAVR